MLICFVFPFFSTLVIAAGGRGGGGAGIDDVDDTNNVIPLKDIYSDIYGDGGSSINFDNPTIMTVHLPDGTTVQGIKDSKGNCITSDGVVVTPDGKIGYYDKDNNFQESPYWGVADPESLSQTRMMYEQAMGEYMNSSSPKSKALADAIEDFMGKIRYVIAFITGIGALTSVIIFISQFVRLAYMPSFPAQRRRVIEDMLQSVITVILFGGATTIMTVFYAPFMRMINSFITYSNDWGSAMNVVLYEYKGFVTGIFGLAALTMLLFFIKNFVKLGASSSNPQARKEALIGLMLTGLGTAGLGGVAIWVGMFWNLLN